MLAPHRRPQADRRIGWRGFCSGSRQRTARRPACRASHGGSELASRRHDPARGTHLAGSRLRRRQGRSRGPIGKRRPKPRTLKFRRSAPDRQPRRRRRLGTRARPDQLDRSTRADNTDRPKGAAPPAEGRGSLARALSPGMRADARRRRSPKSRHLRLSLTSRGRRRSVSCVA
jgi:hypothetical protein